MSVVLPPMTRGQAEAWSGLLDLSERHPTCWTLVGGQMVHLHCIERGVAPTTRSPFAQVPWDEDVDLRLAALPAVLVALPGLADRNESQLDEGGREGSQRIRLSSDVEHGIDVVSRTRRGDASLDAVQVNHLPADKSPAARVTLGQVEQPAPRLGLATGHRRQHDAHAPAPSREAAQPA